jgi:hypothetical protein
MDMSPSRASAVEFDNPTPTRRRISTRKPNTFEAMSAARQQRESIMILDEVGVAEVLCV